jgi:hypothetical protein
MTRDNLEIEPLEGAKQIQAFCRATSAQLGLELLSVHWSWHSTAPAGSDRHHLYVKATIGSHEFEFTCADIEGYSTGQTTEGVNAIIRTALADLLR